LIVVYFGSIKEDAVFEPILLSDLVTQVKHKLAADTKAEGKMQRGAIPLGGTLPGLTLLMELGANSVHQSTGSPLKSTTPVSLPNNKEFQALVDGWGIAVKSLALYQEKKKTNKKAIQKLQEDIKAARLAMDSYNRYSIAVRGADCNTYGILKEANIVQEFATLLGITNPPPTSQDIALQHMRPSERLGETSPHTNWMLEYVVANSDDDEE
jgi:hypothetical protein